MPSSTARGADEATGGVEDVDPRVALVDDGEGQLRLSAPATTQLAA
jgi:hypothetical protein